MPLYIINLSKAFDTVRSCMMAILFNIRYLIHHTLVLLVWIIVSKLTTIPSCKKYKKKTTKKEE